MQKCQKYKTNIFFRLCFDLIIIIALNIKNKIFRSKFYLIILMVNIFHYVKLILQNIFELRKCKKYKTIFTIFNQKFSHLLLINIFCYKIYFANVNQNYFR